MTCPAADHNLKKEMSDCGNEVQLLLLQEKFRDTCMFFSWRMGRHAKVSARFGLTLTFMYRSGTFPLQTVPDLCMNVDVILSWHFVFVFRVLWECREEVWSSHKKVLAAPQML